MTVSKSSFDYFRVAVKSFAACAALSAERVVLSEGELTDKNFCRQFAKDFPRLAEHVEDVLR